MSGTTIGGRAIAVGNRADANRDSTAIGYRAETTSTNATAVGYDSVASGSGVAIGHGAESL